MTLRNVIEELSELPREYTIYAAMIDGQWTLDSLAVVEEEPEDGCIQQTFDGVKMDYFLEIFLARDVIKVWKQWSGDQDPSIGAKLRALVHYKLHDAYLPVD